MQIIISVLLGLLAAVLFRGAWLMVQDAEHRYNERQKK
jgi:hypothetical protein